ncbi:uncharacterized protein C2845_PM12G06350 [Panicum miliaceum]|uniref:Uncharacterized protein n=1 Tax=Panicum miliaceum TaxID=4540 RepID=A0A3L6QJG6_PANMI|nr:uncharacterized protein C2845_PM12G06350 [Panicum miliaceum]
MTDDETRLKRRELGVQICGSAYNPRMGIKVPDIERGLKNRTLTGDLGFRAFFMLEDVRNTEDLENIGTRNWCKAVVDNFSKAARLYKKDFEEKGINTPITSCGIFLTIIDTISALDRRRDAPSGTIEYGNLRRRSVTDTYSLSPAAAPTVALAAAPTPSRSSAATGTSTDWAGASHDPGGHATTNLQPPTICRYPSFSASFRQSIADVVGSRKSEVLNILKAFDDSTNHAQSFMAKVLEYTTIVDTGFCSVNPM